MNYMMTFRDGGHSGVSDPLEDGRYILHRHSDAQGPHRDLRIEEDGVLRGWRITEDGDGAMMAVEKAAHPVHWLNPESGKAAGMVCEERGTYAWVERSPMRAVIRLQGSGGSKTIEINALEELAPCTVHGLRAFMAENRVKEPALSGLLRDGLSARRRAMYRLAGLARELDGEAFDAALWERMAREMTLDELHAHLRCYETRFDAKYPPRPVSQPEPLEAVEGQTAPAVLDILRKP